jgi:hypothetical protein
MAKPVVSPPSSPRSLVIGVAIAPFVLSATGSPGVWTATPLPAGLTLDAATGTITGTPTSAGVTTTSITAANGDGTSDAVTIVWTTATSPAGSGLWSDLEIDVDQGTRIVTVPGLPPLPAGEIFSISRGDSIDLLVGLRKYGVLQDLGASVGVRIAVKQFEAESVIELAGGTATRVQTASLPDTTRYRIRLTMTPANWALLSDYEADAITAAALPTQIELYVGTTRICSDTFLVEVIQDAVPD